MTSVIMMLFLSLHSNAAKFDPDGYARRLHLALSATLSKSPVKLKYSEIDSFSQRLTTWRMACKIELRDHSDLSSCFQMLELGKNLLNRPFAEETAFLTQLKEKNHIQSSINDYIKRRKGQAAGTFSE